MTEISKPKDLADYADRLRAELIRDFEDFIVQHVIPQIIGQEVSPWEFHIMEAGEAVVPIDEIADIQSISIDTKTAIHDTAVVEYKSSLLIIIELEGHYFSVEGTVKAEILAVATGLVTVDSNGRPKDGIVSSIRHRDGSLSEEIAQREFPGDGWPSGHDVHGGYILRGAFLEGESPGEPW